VATQRSAACGERQRPGGVLLAEVGAIGFAAISSLGDNGSDAAKVAWARCAVEAVAEAFNIYKKWLRPRVEFFYRGGEDYIRALGFGEGAVGVEGARIAGEVLVGPELGGVDEDAHGDTTAGSTGGAMSEAWPAWSAPIVGTRRLCFRSDF